ncbi:MAG TPA: M48 family metalloprotease [Longimicrobium sp.]|nr:M48 family metalloprotease [Longimicrobium sp.]
MRRTSAKQQTGSRAGRWVAAALVAGNVVACAVNPVTGRNQLSLVSEAQEIQLGRQSAVQVSQQLGLVPDSALQAYVQRVGGTLAAASERPALPWTFRVVDDPTPNAFALPGGYIFVTRGLMAMMTSEAELASVLGHEIGHVTAKHQVTMISRSQLAQIGLGLGSVLAPQLQGLASAASTGLQLLFLRYSRDAERQADLLGFRYALGQQYDVREMAKVFQTLQRVEQAQAARTGRSPVPTWAASHPGEEARIADVERRVAALAPGTPASRVEGPQYLNRLNGMLYGENPRQGFFQQNVFLHPDLRFSLTFPGGWQTQNLPQSVTGVSQRQDAMVQLTLVQQARGADEAARAFFSQQGVQAGQGGRTTVNGLPAVVVPFQAQTQQGVVAGMAAFIEHNGTVFHVLAYTPAQLYGQYQGLFRQVIGSFGPVSDPSVLNVRPTRVNVVRLPQAMTLAEFNRRYPSTIPIEELAIINQVPGATSTLPAGALAKRIIRQ